MAKIGYSIITGGAVSLSASTAKSVLGVQAGESFSIDLKKIWLGFTGVTASEAPVTCELCLATFATNGPGTNSTSVTPIQLYGRTTTVGATAAKNWTSEPTVLTTIAEFPLTPNGGTVLYDWPLGDTPDCALGNGFVLRCTAAATVSVRASMTFERA
ncbi:hypothetical protein [Streptomyces sp.]|uniref:hypothetical protein n=1 Tax=Streptomyces sp. TaxID=1931 RepID=UPI002F948296